MLKTNYYNLRNTSLHAHVSDYCVLELVKMTHRWILSIQATLASVCGRGQILLRGWSDLFLQRMKGYISAGLRHMYYTFCISVLSSQYIDWQAANPCLCVTVEVYPLSIKGEDKAQGPA